jgi:uncharacterized radical SAM superfamily protein
MSRADEILRRYNINEKLSNLGKVVVDNSASIKDRLGALEKLKKSNQKDDLHILIKMFRGKRNKIVIDPIRDTKGDIEVMKVLIPLEKSFMQRTALLKGFKKSR